MKKSYFIIPSLDIWNNNAIVSYIRNAIESKDEAIERAKELSRKYNSAFIVCSIETVVSVEYKITALE